MFTIEQIAFAHSKIKSGADFPKYIQELKSLGVKSYETYVLDSHTDYFGENNFEIKSKPKYENLSISNEDNKERFVQYLKSHQKGETDYFTFCKHCAETGIEKWIVNSDKMTCTYYSITGNEILIENIPS